LFITPIYYNILLDNTSRGLFQPCTFYPKVTRKTAEAIAFGGSLNPCFKRNDTMHKPILINDLGLSFPQKSCFANFNAQIRFGNRIAIIGNNGSGKSTLLKILQGKQEPSQGEIIIPSDVVFGYVPQVIEDFDSLSGGQRLQKSLTKALALEPNVLLLDEPTNHLDQNSRKSLMRMLQGYTGTLIIVSHDAELLRHCINTLWHINKGEVHLFSGNYDDYLDELDLQRTSIEQELSRVSRQKKEMHQSLMREQQRAATSRAKGEKSIAQRKWPTVVSKTKVLNAQETSGKKRARIESKKQDLIDKLSSLQSGEKIIPKFSLSHERRGEGAILSISDGTVGWQHHPLLLKDISLHMNAKDRIAICGDNGSGKSTLVKAILNNPEVTKTGHWVMPKPINIGYLDQHYATLDPQKTVLETLSLIVPSWPYTEVRKHLNDFLFRKNEEINALTSQLSGGEKVRLCLAQIAARPPQLLILDEITNNLDLETKEHVIQVLQDYPGAMLLICHEGDFLNQLRITGYYHILNNSLVQS